MPQPIAFSASATLWACLSVDRALMKTSDTLVRQHPLSPSGPS
jgi:hypothetical protein